MSDNLTSKNLSERIQQAKQNSLQQSQQSLKDLEQDFRQALQNVQSDYQNALQQLTNDMNDKIKQPLNELDQQINKMQTLNTNFGEQLQQQTHQALTQLKSHNSKQLNDIKKQVNVIEELPLLVIWIGMIALYLNLSAMITLIISSNRLLTFLIILLITFLAVVGIGLAIRTIIGKEKN